ncbi:MAG: aminoacyl-tRNA hydrolase [Gammaproteobacteria bacterium TMED78]|nr:MAG: aminoacyl-tRNA hydrolase [Gammaproteobacteria bacterium TMED78]|tara:strand:- start:4004 stop:4588 length:585 start_codon:yes stop_codon:yes gene_type:complete
MKEFISLIAGLGNPEEEYSNTRHNVGFNFTNYLSKAFNKNLLLEKRFEGEITDIYIESRKIFLLKPLNYMNNSGKSVFSVASYYKIKPENILIVHDDLDLPIGISKLKFSGGHGGHNGVRDIINQVGKDFWRLRLGIGHPGNNDKDKVTNHVLGKMNDEEISSINSTIEFSVSILHCFLTKGSDYAINKLHNKN